MEEERNGAECVLSVCSASAPGGAHTSAGPPALTVPRPRLGSPSCAGWGRTGPPFRLRGPHDSCLRCSRVTYQEREPRAPSRLPRVSQVGLGERDSHSGLCGLKVCFGGAEISLGANLLNPCLSPVAKRALSPAGVPASSVEEIAGRGCFT